MLMPHKRHTISFKYALAGVMYAMRTQPNFLIHLSISSLVVLAGVVFKITHIEWIILSLVITLGLVIELVNTAIEATVDLATSEIHPLAKIAKDTASAAMLMYALGAAIIGLLLFVPKLWLFI
jgi:undecaprenol kinase